MADSLSQEVRVLTQKGPVPIDRVGVKANYFSDAYHFLMVAPWWKVIGIVFAIHSLMHLAFALGFFACGNCIENARPHSFMDAYFFSVQTLYTIGYGFMHPIGLYANALVALESFCGLIVLALVTGIFFAKFSRPTARVLFSKGAVIRDFYGVPHLMFRMANERANSLIMEAQVNVAVLKMEISPEGKSMRRLHDLKLVRQKNPMFTLSWTVMHPIDAESPLYGRSIEVMKQNSDNIVVTLTGIDNIFSQTIHAQHAYIPSELVEDHDFVDIFAISADSRKIDYTKFHDIKPMPHKSSRTSAPIKVGEASS